MKQQKIKMWISSLVALCITIGGLAWTCNILQPKYEKNYYSPFLDNFMEYDVLFLGNSHIVQSVYPMELWEDFGIASYNLGANGATIPTSYWNMRYALDYANPKLVVVDCYSLTIDMKARNLAMLHACWDSLPLTKTKLLAIQDLLGEPQLVDEEGEWKKEEFIWGFVKYHNRWKSLDEGDFLINEDNRIEKGAHMTEGLSTYKESFPITNEKIGVETLSMSYLEKIICYCQDRNIEVLLTYIPYPADEYRQKEANTVYSIAEKYNVDYLNFLKTEVVDYKSDLYDRHHLNVSGGHKITTYLGNYICENYQIPNRKGDKNYLHWEEDYNKYIMHKNVLIKEQETLEDLLLFLADKDYDTFIELNNLDLLKYEPYSFLLENLGVDISQISDKTDAICIKGGKEVTILENCHEAGTVVDTVLGEYSIFYDEEENYGIYVDGNEFLIINQDDEDIEDIDIRVSVYQTGQYEPIRHSIFDYELDARPEVTISMTESQELVN